jgi:hypothetical protein
MVRLASLLRSSVNPGPNEPPANAAVLRHQNIKKPDTRTKVAVMTFNVIQMIPKDANFGRLWPVPADDSGPMLVAQEDLDGDSIISMPVKTVSVMVKDKGQFKQLGHLPNLKDAWLYLTDARAIFAVANFNPGGGWSGSGMGFFIAEAANAVSKSRHRSLAKNTIVAGHIRYQWLRAIIAEPRWGIVPQTLCLFYTPGDKTQGQDAFHLKLQLGKAGNWAVAAREVVRRAAAFDLGNYDVPDEKKPTMEQLAKMAEPAAKITQTIPWYLPANEVNA